jgi:hypothetical protein
MSPCRQSTAGGRDSESQSALRFVRPSRRHDIPYRIAGYERTRKPAAEPDAARIESNQRRDHCAGRGCRALCGLRDPSFSAGGVGGDGLDWIDCRRRHNVDLAGYEGMTSDRKKPGVAFWATVALVAVLVGYPLSAGPAIWIAMRTSDEVLLSHPVNRLYAPVWWFCDHGPRPIRDLACWSLNLWGS